MRWERALPSIPSSPRSRRIGILLTAALAGSVLGIGCAPRGPQLPPLEPGREGGERLVRFLGETGCPLDLKTDLELHLSTPEHRSIKMMGSLRAVWPDRLRIQTRVGPFWPVASVAVRADSAFVSLPRLKGYWAGTFTGSSGDDPASLASTLLWLLCPSSLAEQVDDPVLEGRPGGWFLTGRLRESDPAIWLQFELPHRDAEVSTIRFLDAEGIELMKATRSGRVAVGDALLPRRVRIESRDPEVAFEVRLLRPRRDPDQPAGLFRIGRPPGTVWVPREQLLDLFGTAGEGP